MYCRFDPPIKPNINTRTQDLNCLIHCNYHQKKIKLPQIKTTKKNKENMLHSSTVSGSSTQMGRNKKKGARGED